MRVRELAKELSNDLGRTIASSELLKLLNKKNDALVAASNVSEDLIKYIRDIYYKTSDKSQIEAKNAEKKAAPLICSSVCLKSMGSLWTIWFWGKTP